MCKLTANLHMLKDINVRITITAMLYVKQCRSRIEIIYILHCLHRRLKSIKLTLRLACLPRQGVVTMQDKSTDHLRILTIININICIKALLSRVDNTTKRKNTHSLQFYGSLSVGCQTTRPFSWRTSLTLSNLLKRQAASNKCTASAQKFYPSFVHVV